MPYYFPHQTFSNLRTCSEHDHYTPNAFYVFRKSHASNFSKKVTIYFVIFNVETVAIHLLLHSKQKVAKAGPPLFSWWVLTFQLKKLSQSEVSSSFQGLLLPIPFITSELQKDHNAIQQRLLDSQKITPMKTTPQSSKVSLRRPDRAKLCLP